MLLPIPRSTPQFTWCKVRFIQRLTLSLFCHHLVPYTATRCRRPHSPKPPPLCPFFSALNHTLRSPSVRTSFVDDSLSHRRCESSSGKRAAELQPRSCNKHWVKIRTVGQPLILRDEARCFLRNSSIVLQQGVLEHCPAER